MRRFQASGAPKLSAAEAERQGRVTKRAIEALGVPAAITFLNAEHDGLPDRPLRLAIASEDGLETVLRLLADQATTSANQPA